LKPRVFITKPIPKKVENYIAHFCEYKIWNSMNSIPKETLIKEIRHVDGLMNSNYKISKEILEAAPFLKIISNISVGYDSFDIKEMLRRKIMGTNTPKVLEESVADLTIGLILSISRRIPELNNMIKKGEWDKPSDFYLGIDVHQSTLGIIGMGRIGEEIAKRATLGFEMDVLYYNRSRKIDVEKKYSVTYTKLDKLLEKSDFVLIMLPLTKQTYKYIGAKQFKKMKKSAFLINCSRGEVINEQELINALLTNEIAGSALDVYEQEPISKRNPLLKMDNVVMTPHIGSATKNTRYNMAMKAAKNLVSGLMGEKPYDIVPELKQLIN